jgi:hypothetical protein
MALYSVREGYVVHLENSKTLSPGAIFEPDQEVLGSQGWKIEPVKESEAVAEQTEQAAKDVETPPQDRMIKKPQVQK